MRKRLAAAIATLATVGGITAFAPAASAVPAGCANGSGYACVWKDIHYVTNGTSADYFRFGLYVTDFRGFYYRNTSTHPYLNISSAYNGGLYGEAVYYYKGINCSGSTFSMQASSGDSDYTNGSPSGSWNDQTVSGAYATQISKCRAG